MRPIPPWAAKRAAPLEVLETGSFAGEADARPQVLAALAAHATAPHDEVAKRVAVVHVKVGYTQIHALLHAHIAVQHSQSGLALAPGIGAAYLAQPVGY